MKPFWPALVDHPNSPERSVFRTAGLSVGTWSRRGELVDNEPAVYIVEVGQFPRELRTR